MVADGCACATPFVEIFTEQITELDIVRFRIINPYSNEPTKADFEWIDGAIFTGSTVAWSVTAEEAAPQRAAMHMAFGLGVPCWGSCNGFQLAAAVLGGRIGSSPLGFEVGLAQSVKKTSEGRHHPMLNGRSDTSYSVPCIHRDEVQELPLGATLLAGNSHSPIQAFAVETTSASFWGTQYHPELSCKALAKILRGSVGIFQKDDDENNTVVVDLESAETDSQAALRLGTTPTELSLQKWAVELVNWLAHVRSTQALLARGGGGGSAAAKHVASITPVEKTDLKMGNLTPEGL